MNDNANSGYSYERTRTVVFDAPAKPTRKFKVVIGQYDAPPEQYVAFITMKGYRANGTYAPLLGNAVFGKNTVDEYTHEVTLNWIDEFSPIELTVERYFEEIDIIEMVEVE